MSDERQIVVIGAGPAGLVAAREAARLGAQVYLFSDGPMGGRAGWHSLLPSKVVLQAARRQAGRWMQPQGVMRMVEQMHTVAGLRFNTHQQELLAAGVRIIPARARFTGPHDLVFSGPRGDLPLSFHLAIIASGSVPWFPPGLQPDGQHILGPRHARALQQLPESVLVVGGGVTGAEYAWAFLAMGVEVTWLVDGRGVLPEFDRALVQPLLDRMRAGGLVLEQGVAVASVAPDEWWSDWVVAELEDGRRFEAEKAFIATGRRPDTGGLGLHALGLDTPPKGPAAGGVAVDDGCRSALPHVFAAGDVTGSPMIANRAEAQGLVAARSAMGVQSPPLVPHAWVRTVSTAPQLAQVGLSPERAAARGGARVLRRDYLDSLERLLHGVTQTGKGFLHLVIDEQDDRVLGASAFGLQATETLAPVAMAIELGLTRGQLARVHVGYPGLLDLPFLAARGASRGHAWAAQKRHSSTRKREISTDFLTE